MKYIYIFFITLIFSCTNSNNYELKPNYYKIEGIKKVEEYQIDYKFGVIDSTTKELRKITFYDNNGNPNYETEYYTINGVLDSNVTNFKYDKFGNLIEEKNLVTNGKINSYIKYEYNDANEQIKMIHFDEFGNIDYTKEFLYDKGEKVQINEYDSKNEMRRITKLKYKDGYESEVLVFNKLNQLTSKKLLIKVDNEIVYMDEYNEESKLIRKTESKYKNGFEISFKIIDDSPISGLFFESFYNENNLINKTISYTDNKPYFISEYKYFK